MRADGGAGFAYGGRETHVVASEGRGEGFGGCEECGDAGAHFAEGVEDAVEDYEEGKYGLLWGG